MNPSSHEEQAVLPKTVCHVAQPGTAARQEVSCAEARAVRRRAAAASAVKRSGRNIVTDKMALNGFREKKRK